VLQWRFEQIYDTAQAASGGDSQKSEQLERLRKARADISELDLREPDQLYRASDHRSARCRPLVEFERNNENQRGMMPARPEDHARRGSVLAGFFFVGRCAPTQPVDYRKWGEIGRNSVQ
jgi:hypothetical protein